MRKDETMHNLKQMGLTLVALLAIGAIAASAAPANQFHSSALSTAITRSANATQVYQYETGGQSVQCTTVGGSGKLGLETNIEILFEPIYSNCSVSGIAFSTAQVNMNNCSYRFRIEVSENKGPVDLTCPKIVEQENRTQVTITVKVFGISICTLHIGHQTPSGVADYANSGSTKVNVQPTQTGISATRQGSEECGEATSTTGSYTGQSQAKGEETGTENEKAIQVG
jgi:hypothetical protein